MPRAKIYNGLHYEDMSSVKPPGDYHGRAEKKKATFPVFVCEGHTPHKVFQRARGEREMELQHFSPFKWYRRDTCLSCKNKAKLAKIKKLKGELIG